MASLKCKSCGGELEIMDDSTVCECEYCGLKQTVPVMDDEKKIKLFERANRLRLNCEFDKAAGIYENIVEEFSEEAEGYWGLVLCKYGIEYVDDPAGDKVPTCHRSSFDSVMEDKDLELAMEYADIVAKRVYREQAKQLEEIRRGIIDVVGKEEPYDIFICYKETDENGDRTVDSVMAQDIYEALKEKGYRVFFSRISLEDKLGVEYEPFIFAALNSAKVMLAVGTDYEYYDAVWVKNEWSRYLKLMAKDKSKHLIPCYKNLDAYDIPKEFAHLQAQDMGKVGALQDLVRGIEKLIGNRNEDKTVNAPQVVQQVVAGGPSVDALLKRGYMALEDLEWEKAQEYFDQVLNMNAECGDAYIGLYMSENKLKNEKELHNNVVRLKDFTAKEYRRAKQFATPDMLDKLNQWESERAEKIRRENEEAEKKRLEAEQLAEQKRKEKAEWKKIVAQLLKEEEEDRKEKISTLKNQIINNEFDLTKEEQTILDTIQTNLSDSEEKLKSAEITYEKLSEHTEIGSINQMLTEKKAYFSTLGMFMLGEKKKVQSEIDILEEKKRKCDVIIMGYKADIEQNKEEVSRCKRECESKKEEITASHIRSLCCELIKVAGMKGLSDIVKEYPEIKNYIPRIEIVNKNIGDEIEFGNDKYSNKWIILDKQDNRTLIISKYAICQKEYNKEFVGTTWENCTLRKWLNNDYLINEFNESERLSIGLTTIANANNQKHRTNGGNDTKDKVFLLSIDEVKRYFKSNNKRQATLTDGTSVNWWLRSPGSNSKSAAVINSDGSVDEIGRYVNLANDYRVHYGHVFVRPALWIDILNR